MHIGLDTEQVAWRSLFADLLHYDGDRWTDQVIWPWASVNGAVIRELDDIGRPECRTARIRESSNYSPLEGLYAMGRVLDVLIAPYQPVNDDPALLNWVSHEPWWTGFLPDQAVLPALAEAIGAARITEDRFCPFFHEIVTVEPRRRSRQRA
jgi:hypothetical protein